MIKIDNISKKFDSDYVFSNINLEIDEGKIYTIVGPSGCGKTTLLNIISGLEKPTSGQAIISGNYNLGYLLQENVMLPWRGLRENIRLGCEVRGVRNSNESAITNYIERFGLAGYEEYYPDSLSGGMKQRAALIRFLVTEPDILLMDEPYNFLDIDIKLKIQKELLAYQMQKKATIIMVTHDIEDAIALSDEIFVFTLNPTTVKASTVIDLGLVKKDPVLARESVKFPQYFAQIWKDLKYVV